MLSFLYPLTILLLPSVSLLASADELARAALTPLRRTPASGVIAPLLHLPFGKSDKLQRVAARATCPIGYHECADVDGCCVIGEYCAYVSGVHGCCPNGKTCTPGGSDSCVDPGYSPCSGSDSVCCPVGATCYQDDFGDIKCRGGSTGGGNTITTTTKQTTSVVFTTSTTDSFSFNIPSVTSTPVIPTVVTVTAGPTTTGSGFTFGGANSPSPTNAATSKSSAGGMGMLSLSVVMGVLFSWA